MAKSKATARPRGVDVRVEIANIDQYWRTIRTLIRAAAVVVAIWVGLKGLAPFAGENTVISLALSFVADIKFALSVILGGTAAAWAFVERRLRYRKTEYLQGRIKELELKIDPNRTSSNLTPKGKTNPTDRRA